MKKKIYETPSMMVVEIQQHTCLLQASKKPNAPDYDGYLSYNGGSKDMA